MVRIKRGTIANKRRKKVLKYTKGFHWGRKAKYALAKDAIKHAWKWSYQDRKDKKGNFRQLWQTIIAGQCEKQGISYSKFINGLKTKKIEIDRKVLALLVKEHPDLFEKIVEATK